MRINCPDCGLRPVSEFSYGGDASVTRPDDQTVDNTQAWVDYVYYRNNPCGVHREYWHHVNGCRAWLILERNTKNHQIISVCHTNPSRLNQPPRQP